MNGVGLNFKYYGHVGVDNQGNPVYFDPKKAKAKTPIFIDFKDGTTPEQRKEIAKDIEARIKQQEEIAKILKENGKINPLKDKVFLDANGELTTWKPGIIDPKAEEKQAAAKKKAVTLAGALIAAGLAFVFRGKIKTGALKAAEALKPYAEKVLTKGKGLIQKGLKFAQPVIEKGKGLAKKGIELVKPAIAKCKDLAGKAVAYAKNLVK